MNFKGLCKMAFDRLVVFPLQRKNHDSAIDRVAECQVQSTELVNALTAFGFPSAESPFLLNNIATQARRQRVDMQNNGITEYLDVIETAVTVSKQEMENADLMSEASSQYFDGVESRLGVFRQWHEKLSEEDKEHVAKLPIRYEGAHPASLKIAYVVIQKAMAEKLSDHLSGRNVRIVKPD